MKKIKNYAMAMVALVIAATSVTLMSFNKVDDLVWFPVEDGQIKQDQQVPGPNTECTLETQPHICMVAFRESQLANGEAPTNNPNDSSVEEYAYSSIEP